MSPARVKIYRHRRRRHVLFQRVPALLCRACGHRVFEAQAVEAMERRLNNPSTRRRTAELVILTA